MLPSFLSLFLPSWRSNGRSLKSIWVSFFSLYCTSSSKCVSVCALFLFERVKHVKAREPQQAENKENVREGPCPPPCTSTSEAMSLNESDLCPQQSSSQAVAAGSSLPSCVYLDGLCLTLTTTSRSVDGPATLFRSESGISRQSSGLHLTRRSSREASLQTFCFVAEADDVAGNLVWYYAPLEDYTRKKLRVDEAVVKCSLLEHGSAGRHPTGSGNTKAVHTYYRLPNSTTFRQLALVEPSPAGLSSAPSAASQAVVKKPKLASAHAFHAASSFAWVGSGISNRHSVDGASYEPEAQPPSNEEGGKGGDVPPPLTQLFADQNPQREGESNDESCTLAELCERKRGACASEAGHDSVRPFVPQSASLLPVPRSVESDSVTMTSSTPMNYDGLTLSITLQQSPDEEEECLPSPRLLREDPYSTSFTATCSTSSIAPHRPPKLRAPLRSSGRLWHRKHSLQAPTPSASTVNSAVGPSPLHPCSHPTASTPLGAAGRAGSSGSGSCAGMTEQSVGADYGMGSEDPSSSRRTSSSIPHSSSDLAKAAAAFVGSCGIGVPEAGTGVTANPSTLVQPPPCWQQQQQPLEGAYVGTRTAGGALEGNQTRLVRSPAVDGLAKRPAHTPARPNIRRSIPAASSMRQ